MNGYLYMRLRQMEREQQMKRDVTEIALTVIIVSATLLVVAL